jgi:hypothetical protein
MPHHYTLMKYDRELKLDFCNLPVYKMFTSRAGSQDEILRNHITVCSGVQTEPKTPAQKLQFYHSKLVVLPVG